MATQSKLIIHWAKVEYQPNLACPTKPIPLGVIVEEIYDLGRRIVIAGRMPTVPLPELQLENAWGPFRQSIMGWIEIFTKGIRESLQNISPDVYVLDEFSQRWKWNLYIQKPQMKELAQPAWTTVLTRPWRGIAPKADLVNFAVAECSNYVGERVLIQEPQKARYVAKEHPEKLKWMGMESRLEARI